MGMELNKCSGCLCTKEEVNTARFESDPLGIKAPINDKDNTPVISLTDSLNAKDLKNFVKTKSAMSDTSTKPQLNFFTPIRSSLPASLVETAKPINAYVNSLPLIITIQKHYRGISFRHHYPSLKEKQIEETNQMLKDLTELYTKFNLKRAESLIGNKYDRDGWKKLYLEDREHLFKAEGFALHTRIVIVEGVFTAFYSGQVNMSNQRNGFGVLLQSDGSKLEGHWLRNSFTGWGRRIDAEGTFYEGCFKDGDLCGKGIKRTLNGNNYIGDFVDNRKEGKGKEETNEHIYEGEFFNDKKNGNGKLVYKFLKDSYEGEFKDNCITGIGFYTWANQDTFNGSFVNGKMHGKGLYKWPDGVEYYGDYVNNIKEGNGIFKWVNGKVYEGQFRNGRPSGYGKLKTGSKEVEVEFKDGKLISNPK